VQRDYIQWHSSNLGRGMEMLVFGHGGAPVLVFPTSMGRFFQYEDSGMVDVLRHHIEQGWIQLYCVDAVDGESWYNTGAHPHDRAVRHNQYEAYLLNEVLPYIRSKNGTAYLMLTGNSFGAYHAVNLALKHPWLVNRVIAISGTYNTPFLQGGTYDDEAIYFNSPVDYLPNLSEPRYLDALRSSLEIKLVVGGTGDICHGGTLRLASAMAAKGLPYTLDIWDQAWHDWPWWRQMVLKHI
jgi:esterase/lipase superfamily enzyme